MMKYIPALLLSFEGTCICFHVFIVTENIHIYIVTAILAHDAPNETADIQRFVVYVV